MVTTHGVLKLLVVFKKGETIQQIKKENQNLLDDFNIDIKTT